MNEAEEQGCDGGGGGLGSGDCGRQMEDFTPLMQLLLGAGGITQVEGIEVLGGAVEEVLRSPEEARAVAERGRLALEQHRGATRRSVAAIGEVVGE